MNTAKELKKNMGVEPKKTMAEIAADLPENGEEIIEGEEIEETGDEPVETEETPENNEHIETTPENGKPAGEGEDTPPADPPTPPAFDPLAFVETLDLPEDQKKVMRDGFLRQADYTRKTQELARNQKDLEDYQTRGKPILEKIFSDPKLTKLVLGIDPEDNGDMPPADDVPPEDPLEYANWVQNRILNEIRKQTEADRKKQEEIEGQRKIWEARRSDALEAEKIDQRLTSDTEFQSIVAGLVLQDKRYTSGEISAVQATKEAIAFVDKRFKSIQTEAKNKLVKKANEKPSLLGNENSPAEPVAGKPKNMREAFSSAEKEGLF